MFLGDVGFLPSFCHQSFCLPERKQEELWVHSVLPFSQPSPGLPARAPLRRVQHSAYPVGSCLPTRGIELRTGSGHQPKRPAERTVSRPAADFADRLVPASGPPTRCQVFSRRPSHAGHIGPTLLVVGPPARHRHKPGLGDCPPYHLHERRIGGPELFNSPAGPRHSRARSAAKRLLIADGKLTRNL